MRDGVEAWSTSRELSLAEIDLRQVERYMEQKSLAEMCQTFLDSLDGTSPVLEIAKLHMEYHADNLIRWSLSSSSSRGHNLADVAYHQSTARFVEIVNRFLELTLQYEKDTR